MNIKLRTKHHLEFLSIKGGCTGSSESRLVKIPHCWKSHVVAQLSLSSGDAKSYAYGVPMPFSSLCRHIYRSLTLCPKIKFSCFCLLLIFSKSTFSHNSFRNTIGSRSGPIKTSDLIWVQSVCKGYQQAMLVGSELRMVAWMTLFNSSTFYISIAGSCFFSILFPATPWSH